MWSYDMIAYVMPDLPLGLLSMQSKAGKSSLVHRTTLEQQFNK